MDVIDLITVLGFVASILSLGICLGKVLNKK